MNTSKLKAAAVHLYTGLGVPLAFIAFGALSRQDGQTFLLALWLAAVIDATDGVLARRYRVQTVLPSFNGRRLDDIIDYLTYVFLPSMGIIEFGFLSGPLAWLAVLPLAASAYGFSQEQAKTDETFVGFPSYWNVVFLYLYILTPPAWVTAGVLIGFSILVFVPLHYLYPSHARRHRGFHMGLGAAYGIITGVLALFPNAAWADGAARVSLLYPAYYLGVSFFFQQRLKKGTPD